MKPERIGTDGILTKLIFLPKTLATTDNVKDAEDLRNLEKTLA
jgi:hypothetical protein